MGFQIPIVSGIPNSLSCIPDSKAQAPFFFQKMDSTIQWINIRVQANYTIQWVEIYPTDSVIHLLNDWGQGSGFHKKTFPDSGFHRQNLPFIYLCIHLFI